jgi:uncharacterized protein YcgI (DUF1989 family)
MHRFQLTSAALGNNDRVQAARYLRVVSISGNTVGTIHIFGADSATNGETPSMSMGRSFAWVRVLGCIQWS